MEEYNFTDNTSDDGMSIEDAVAFLSQRQDSHESAATRDDSVDETPSEVVETEETEQPVEDSVEADDTSEDVETEVDETTAPVAITDDAEITLPDGSKITVAEAKNGYMRYSDFTTKSQENARLKEKYLGAETQVAEMSTIAQQRYEAIQNEMEDRMRLWDVPDFDRLLEEDPQQYLKEKEKLQKVSELYHHVKTERIRLAEREATIRKAAHEQTQTRVRNEFHSLHPEILKDEKVLNGFANFLGQAGFSRADIDAVDNSKVLSLAYQAFCYQQLKSESENAKKVVANVAPMVPPGTSSRSGSVPSISRKSRNAFIESGSIADAINWMNNRPTKT